MTKKQKALLWVSVLLFVVPEVIWSPVINFYYELFNTSKIGGTTPLRDSFLQNPDNLFLLKSIIFTELIGALSTLVIICKNRGQISNLVHRWILVIVVLLLVVMFGFAFYFVNNFKPDIL